MKTLWKGLKKVLRFFWEFLLAYDYLKTGVPWYETDRIVRTPKKVHKVKGVLKNE